TMFFTYNSNLFNTSSFAVKPFELGSKSLRIRPTVDDSILIRLDDSKGMELFPKLQERDPDVLRDDNFQEYFKGISLAAGSGDTTAVYGLKGSGSAMVLRVFYYNTTPYFQSQCVDFQLK